MEFRVAESSDRLDEILYQLWISWVLVGILSVVSSCSRGASAVSVCLQGNFQRRNYVFYPQ